MGRVEATSAFAGDPQPVEVLHRGAWYAGELLGWRHEADGRCRARVRCVVDGLRHTAWVELADLRLPAPTGSPGPSVPALPPPSAAPRTSRRPAATASPSQEPAPATARPARRELAAGHGGRHRFLAEDDTQPHVLLADRVRRPPPAGLPLPAPRRRTAPDAHGLPAVP